MNTTVTINHQGKSYEVECDGFDSILDAAIDHGIEDLSYDCKMGVCMTCPSKVKSGNVTMDGAMLSDDVAEMGFALLCVSLPDGNDVTIDTVTEEELLDVQLQGGAM
jgi:ferredoxin|tara:strand:+ start:269 stop:589 length:321 start_codon:yes stop_codon:yes gene_type:complete